MKWWTRPTCTIGIADIHTRICEYSRVTGTGLDLRRRIASEACGTAFLLVAVVGSGIMGERLAGGNVALALLANSLATGAALVALILVLGSVSGAYFNPAVTLAAAWQGQLPWKAVPGYLSAQVAGALGGVLAAHVMFGEPLVSLSQHARGGIAQLAAELIATFGLVAVISGTRRRPLEATLAVAAYITGAYWFTSSTSFANPAVTLARSLTDTFSGIRPQDVAGFVAAQLLGAAAAAAAGRWLFAEVPGARAVTHKEPADHARRAS